MLIAAVTAWLVAAAAALIATGATRMTSPPAALDMAVDLALGAGCVIVPGLLVSRYILRRVWSCQLAGVLALFAALMCVGVAINVAGWCPDFCSEAPELAGTASDSGREWMVAQALYTDSPLPFPANTGYPLLLCALWRLTGVNIIAPALLSALCMLLTAAVATRVALVMLPSHSPRQVGLWSAATFAAVPSIVWYGTLAMKEAPVCLAFALCTYTLAIAWKGRLEVSSLLSGGIGCLMLMLLKSPLAWLLVAGTAMAAIRIFVIRSSQHIQRSTASSLFLLLAAGATLAGGAQFRVHPAVDFIHGEQRGEFNPQEYLQDNMFADPSTHSYARVLGPYYTLPVGEKLLRLPFTATAQYFPPFPWNFTRDVHIGRFVGYAHLPLWYLVGGMALGYLVLCAGRKGRSGGLGLWSAWIAVCWCVIAFCSAGSVGRYWLPLLPAIIPLALQFAACVRRRNPGIRPTVIYTSSYILLLAIGLTAARLALY